MVSTKKFIAKGVQKIIRCSLSLLNICFKAFGLCISKLMNLVIRNGHSLTNCGYVDIKYFVKNEEKNYTDNICLYRFECKIVKVKF